MEKRRNCSWGAISPLFHNIFNIHFYLKESNYIVICKNSLFKLFFLNTTNLMCRSTDISNCFLGSLRFRDNESRLYFPMSFCVSSIEYIHSWFTYLTFKAPITTATDDVDIHKYFIVFQRKEDLMFPLQRIHMKNQALFSSKDKSKKLKCRLLQFLFGALRVNFPKYSSHKM